LTSLGDTAEPYPGIVPRRPVAPIIVSSLFRPS